MRRANSILLGFGLLFLNVPAHADFCPPSDTLKTQGIPEGFAYVSNIADPNQYSKVYGFDSALLDQTSAKIKEVEGVAESAGLNCRYDAAIVTAERTIPFYLIKPLVPEGMKLRVNLSERGWGGFCREPREQQIGCIVVCHNDVAACPFEFVPAD